jgi:hypothetical protein
MEKEIFKNIEGFPGYQIGNHGTVLSFWKRKHYPTGYGIYNYISDEPIELSQSDDGNGYMKVMLYCKLDGKRYCRKVHRLVAEAFVPNPNDYDTVDHIKSGRIGKFDNSDKNLRWLPRSLNIKKAYDDGMHDRRIGQQNKPIVAIDLYTMKEKYYNSIKEASEDLRIDRCSISHVLKRDYQRTDHYTFEYAGREELLLYGTDEDNQSIPWI